MFERLIAAPSAGPAQLARFVAALPGSGITESLLQELPGLADRTTGMVALHGREFAGWMHRAFPLECPAPHSQKVTNPMTPDEWMGDGGPRVQELEGMMAEIAQVLVRYTTMGNETGQAAAGVVADGGSSHGASADVVSISQPASQQWKHARPHLLATTFRFMAMSSMMVLVAIAAKSGEDFTIDERNLLSVGFKNLIGSQRGAIRTIGAIEQNPKYQKFGGALSDYKKKIEAELYDKCTSIVKIV